MKRALVIETEIAAQEQIKKQLKEIDPTFDIYLFSNFKDFEVHAKNLPVDQQPNFFDFNIIILDYSLLNIIDWKKKIEWFQGQNKINGRVCFTGYDSPNMRRKLVFDLPIFNFFFKPLDPLILKESINIALNFTGAAKPLELKPQTAKAFAAILKSVELVSICELGFITLNETAIPMNTVSKYFKDIFSYNKKQSIWAECIMSIEIPDQPGTFINKFQFVGIEHGQLMNLRQFINQNKHKRVANAVWNLESMGNEKPVKIAIVDTEATHVQTLKHDLETHYKNVQVDYIQVDLNQLTTRNTNQYHCIINLNHKLDFAALKTYFSHDSMYLLFLFENITEKQFLELQPHYKNIFTHPLDRSYFFKKLRILLKDLIFNEVPELVNISYTEKIKAINMVRIKEICETYVTFNYHRELPIKSYREFAFIGEDENQAIELPAFCYFTQKLNSADAASSAKNDVFLANTENQQKPTHLHQFVFWGMTDHFLKQIRLWLLHNYIVQNNPDKK
jgi:hypothetical protein